MSSTNKTTHYELSQFLGTDKPAWLNDYNADMSKIDAGINSAQSDATTADGKATTNATSIGTLANLTTDEKASLVGAINEVDGHADSAQGTATAANTSAQSALTEIGKFNLANRQNLEPSASRGTISSTSTYVRYAGDTTGSVFKIYGRIQVDGLSGVSQNVVISMNTPLRPTTGYTIEAFGTMISRTSSAPTAYVRPVTFEITTGGVVTITTETLASDITQVNIIIPPCLYFNADFGD